MGQFAVMFNSYVKLSDGLSISIEEKEDDSPRVAVQSPFSVFKIHMIGSPFSGAGIG